MDRYDKIELTNIDLNTPQLIDNDTCISDVMYNNNDLYFTTEQMEVVSVKDNSIKVRFLSDTPEYYRWMKSFDDIIISKFIDNSHIWFGKKLKTEKVQTLFRQTVEPPEDISHNPVMNINIEGDIFDIYDHETDSVSVGDVITTTVNPSVYFNQDRYYIVYTSVSTKINEMNSVDEYMFAESSISDDM